MKRSISKLFILIGIVILITVGIYIHQNQDFDNNKYKSNVLSDYYYEIEGYKDEEAIRIFKELNDNQLINFDDYYEVVNTEVYTDAVQEIIDEDKIVNYMNYYFHHNTSDFMTVLFSIDKEDVFRMDNKNWIMKDVFLGNAYEEDKKEYTCGENNPFIGGYSNEKGEDYIDVYVNDYIIICNYDVEGYDRYFFKIEEVIDRSQFEDNIINFDDYCLRYDNDKDKYYEFIGANESTIKLLNMLEVNEIFILNNKKYLYKGLINAEFIETEDNPKVGYYYDSDNNIINTDELNKCIVIQYRGLEKQYGFLLVDEVSN